MVLTTWSGGLVQTISVFKALLYGTLPTDSVQYVTIGGILQPMYIEI